MCARRAQGVTVEAQQWGDRGQIQFTRGQRAYFTNKESVGQEQSVQPGYNSPGSIA